MLADDLGDVRDRDEGGAVHVADDLLDGRHLDAREDAVEHGLFAGDHAAALDEGAGAAELFVDRVGDVASLISDDHERLALLHAVFDHVDDAGGDEIGQQAEQRAVDGKEKARDAVDDDVEAEDDLPGGKARFAAEDHGDDLGAVETAAGAENQTHAEAEQDAAEDDDEQILIRDSRERGEHLEQDGEEHHGIERAHEKAPAEALESQKEKRHVEHNDIKAELQGRELREDHADADDAAIENRERDEKLLEREGRDGSADREEQKRQNVRGENVILLHSSIPSCRMDLIPRKERRENVTTSA